MSESDDKDSRIERLESMVRALSGRVTELSEMLKGRGGDGVKIPTDEEWDRRDEAIAEARRDLAEFHEDAMAAFIAAEEAATDKDADLSSVHLDGERPLRVASHFPYEVGVTSAIVPDDGESGSSSLARACIFAPMVNSHYRPESRAGDPFGGPVNAARGDTTPPVAEGATPYGDEGAFFGWLDCGDVLPDASGPSVVMAVFEVKAEKVSEHNYRQTSDDPGGRAAFVGAKVVSVNESWKLQKRVVLWRSEPAATRSEDYDDMSNPPLGTVYGEICVPAGIVAGGRVTQLLFGPPTLPWLPFRDHYGILMDERFDYNLGGAGEGSNALSTLNGYPVWPNLYDWILCVIGEADVPGWFEELLQIGGGPALLAQLTSMSFRFLDNIISRYRNSNARSNPDEGFKMLFETLAEKAGYSECVTTVEESRGGIVSQVRKIVLAKDLPEEE